MTVDELIEAWRVNDAVNHALLAHCPDDTLDLKPGKGKTIRSNFVHLIGVRRMHSEERLGKRTGAYPKLDWQTATREEMIEALNDSRDQGALYLKSLDEKPNRWTAPLYFGYAVAHEAHHRSQIELTLRFHGREMADSAMYELWNWPKL